MPSKLNKKYPEETLGNITYRCVSILLVGTGLVGVLFFLFSSESPWFAVLPAAVSAISFYFLRRLLPSPLVW